MDTYRESNQEQGARIAPDAHEEKQLRLAEQIFYSYLRDVFFPDPQTCYAVWIEDGIYVSALRMEPYRDGLLIEALETAPEYRRRGYAAKLIAAVQDWLAQRGDIKLYSHVNRDNIPSLKTHCRCGFQKCADYAAYIDGSIDRKAYTFLYETKKIEKKENKC